MKAITSILILSVMSVSAQKRDYSKAPITSVAYSTTDTEQRGPKILSSKETQK
jgi:hypothetical protein